MIMPLTDLKCECEHCQEIINQQNRLAHLQSTRRKFNIFIERKALEVRPDLNPLLSS